MPALTDKTDSEKWQIFAAESTRICGKWGAEIGKQKTSVKEAFRNKLKKGKNEHEMLFYFCLGGGGGGRSSGRGTGKH